MELNGVPNDIITNLNPISLVIFIPLVDNFLYPFLMPDALLSRQLTTTRNQLARPPQARRKSSTNHART